MMSVKMLDDDEPEESHKRCLTTLISEDKYDTFAKFLSQSKDTQQSSKNVS